MRTQCENGYYVTNKSKRGIVKNMLKTKDLVDERT